MHDRKQRLAAVLLALVSTSACGGAPEPEPKTAALPKHEPAPAASEVAPPLPRADERCAAVSRAPSDNLSVVLEKVDPKLSAALDRPPADAAAEWAEALRGMAESCKAARIEHPLPSKRVTLSSPAGCKAGAPAQDLVFDFGLEGPKSQLTVKGNVSVQNRPVALDVRVDKSSEPTALCAAGRFAMGDPGQPATGIEAKPSKETDAGPTVSWLPVAFQMVGSVLGLIPFER